MSLQITTKRPYPYSRVRVTPPGVEGAPAGKVRIETDGPCDLNGTEARMLASRLLRWSKPKPTPKGTR